LNNLLIFVDFLLKKCQLIFVAQERNPFSGEEEQRGPVVFYLYLSLGAGYAPGDARKPHKFRQKLEKQSELFKKLNFD
jgi:hypothetical protein